MDAYSLDLRRKKIVEAKQRGMPTAEVARTFGVGASTVKRYAAAAARGGRLPRRSAPAPNRSSTRRRGSCWKPTSKSGRPPPSRRGASS